MSLLPPLPKKNKAWLAAGGIALVGLAAMAVWGEHGLLHLQRLRNEQRALEQTTFDLAQSNERQRQHILRVQRDDRYLEKLVRERLRLVKPGEVIYRLDVPAYTSPRN